MTRRTQRVRQSGWCFLGTIVIGTVFFGTLIPIRAAEKPPESVPKPSAGSPPAADAPRQAANSRDIFREDVAGNAEVERILKTFPGRGEVGDDSEPTPPEEAIKLFEVADGLKIELVAAEASLSGDAAGDGDRAEEESPLTVPPVEQPLFMHFDERGRLWVVQYRQYPFPEGLKVIRYDQHLRAVFDKVPAPPPHHVHGKDKITVYTDTNGDGTYDSFKDAITGLNITTAVVTGRGPGAGTGDQESGAGQSPRVAPRGAPQPSTPDSQLSSPHPYGIYVLNPPYLLFYPDADRDDVPDADPVVCLSGFGIEDTHSVANSLRWGPDGWLYGANGSTSTGNVSSSVTKGVRWEGQCIWRFDPRTHVFEIFAEGGGNTFSSEIDGKGRVFSGTNHGNTRGMYYPQGSYATKSWGKHGPLTNPYAFGYFAHMKHEGDTDRFPQTFVIYEGGALPALYQGNIIAANALHNRVWASEMIRDGSTYRTVDRPPLVTTPDRWFRPVCVEVGPDGAVYIADWYDTRLTHVDPRDNWHKTSGRIYRVVSEKEVRSEPSKPADGNPWVPEDLMAKTDDQLINLFAHPNKWWRQTAARVLGDRLAISLAGGDSSVPADSSFRTNTSDQNRAQPQAALFRLIGLALDAKDGRSLEALWAIHGAGKFDLDLAARLLGHEDKHVRRWTVRLLGDHRRLNDQLGQELVALAKSEPYVQVRTQLASSAKRFQTSYALPIIGALLSRDEDASDPHQPLLLWWALEEHCGDRSDPQVRVPLPTAQPADASRAAVLAMFKDPGLWDVPLVRDVILSRIMQRFAMDNSDAQDGPLPGLEACAQLLALSPSPDHTRRLMTGFLEAYQGREITGLPPSLAAAIDEYQQSLGQSDLALALRLGKDEAVEDALKVIRDESADVPQRLAYIKILGQIDKPQVVSPLLGLIGSSKSDAVKRAAMQALMNYDDPKIGQTICQRYQSTLPAEHDLRSTAHRVLASRAVWTKQFLNELTSYRIKRDTIPLDIVQQMRLHDDPEIQAVLNKLWGKTRSTPDEKRKQVARLRRLIARVRGRGDAAAETRTAGDETRSPNPHQGRELFKKHCGTCHTLFDDGGKTGPNLTGYERTNLDFLLLAIVDPSAAIREEFTQYQVLTNDGRVLTGLIDDQTPTTVTLRGVNNQTTLVNRDDVDILQAMDTSIMPDALVEKFTDDELRDLFAYLTARTPPQ